MSNYGKGDFVDELKAIETAAPQNYSDKCLCELVLDVSGSMSGTPISELNKGIKAFLKEIRDDYQASQRLEIEVITFESSVQLIQKPALVDQVNIPELTPGGGTQMCEAIDLAIQSAETWKANKKANGEGFYRPWIVVITDGYPGDYTTGYEAKFVEATKGKHYVFLPVGVQGADMGFLNKIAGEFGAKELHNLNFMGLFNWLSNSMKQVSTSAPGETINFLPLTI